MVTVSCLLKYLLNNDVTEDNISFVKSQIQSIAEGYYAKGYSQCGLDQRRFSRNKESRISKMTKSFIDWLFDFTNPND